MSLEINQTSQFYRKMAALAIPITIQFFLTASLNMVDSLMVGQLGANSIAAVGVANKITIVLILIFQGFASGAGIFAAQYWGRRDKVGISKISVLTMSIITISSILFTSAVMVFPVQLIQLFSLDTQVVQLGASFITILAVSYFFTGVTILLTVILRSMGEVKRPMYISIFAIAFNTLLNYLFIFGNWGFPEMGIEGAAIATVIARTIQCVFMLILIMQFDLLGSLKGLQLTEVFDWPTVKNYFTISIPSILNHIFWTLGETSYFWVYARMGTDQLAAVTLIDPLMLLSMALFIGLGDASSVMVGNSIGAKEKDQAYDFAKRFLKITVILSIAVGLAIVSIAPIFVGFYNIPPIAADYAKSILLVYALIVPFRMLNMVNNIGVLRPGGDTRFVMYLDLLGVWLVGLPLALLGAYLQLPIYIVFLLANTQEVARVIFGLRRTVSKKWMNDVISKNETFKDDLQKSV